MRRKIIFYIQMRTFQKVQRISSTPEKLELQAVKDLSKLSQTDTHYLEDWKKSKHLAGVEKIIQQQPQIQLQHLGRSNVDCLEQQLLVRARKKTKNQSVPHLNRLPLEEPIFEQEEFQTSNILKRLKKGGNQAFARYDENKTVLDSDKLRKMSLPWLKEIPEARRRVRQVAQKGYHYHHKNKDIIRLKKSKRVVMKVKEELKIVQREHAEKSQKKIEIIRDKKKQEETERKSSLSKQRQKSIESELHSHYNKELDILKKWIQMNKKKNRKSITSLLRQHFQNRYQEKKKYRLFEKPNRSQHKTINS